MVCIFPFSKGNTDYLSENNILKLLGSYGWAGVYIFFVISGYIIPYSLSKHHYSLAKFPAFFLRRFIRIEIPYICSIILFLASFYVVGLYTGEAYKINLISVFLHLFYLNIYFGYDWISPVYWTLAIEFQYYIVIGLIFTLLNTRNFSKYWLPFILLALSFFLKQEFLIFYYFPVFLVGISIFQYHQKLISKEYLYFLTTILFAIIYLRFGIVCASLVSITWLLILEQEIKIKYFHLGKISYSLYLVHVPFGGRLIGFSELFIQGDFIRTILILVILVFTLFASWLYWLVIEKPALKLSKQVKYH